MSTVRTLLVDGVDIQTLPGIIIESMDLFAPGTRRGAADVIPGRRGQLGSELPYDAYTFSVGVTVHGTSEADYIANLRAVGAALSGTNGLVTLTRHLPNSGGTFDAHTAAGQFVGGLSFALLNVFTGQTELTFIQLDGAWWNEGDSTWLVP